jgi:hypothetical protein
MKRYSVALAAVLLTLSWATRAPAQSNPVSFAATTIEVGDRVGASSVGDFNGDGKQDLAVLALTASWSQHTLILLGDGAGHFNFLSEVPSGARAVADFNGDGKQDLVAIDSSNAVIYLGDGTGHFAAANSAYTGCGAPFQLAVGDFNGDGKLDLVTACYFANSVTILPGAGAGGFGTPASFNVSDGPQGLAVGDFNGDGKQDLGVACMPAGIASILLGDGAGSFAPTTNFNAGATPRDIEVGDFNGDGRQDLAVSNPDANAASVMLGNGAGGFGPPISFAVGSNPTTIIAVGDFNGDGKQDLAVPNFGSSDVSILVGDGAGGFGPATNFSVGLSPFGVVVGDFNGDGKQDLVTSNWDSNNVSILLNDRDSAPPTLLLPSNITADATGPSGAAVTYFASATDDTDPNPTVVCSPSSGGTFPVGTTTVQCTATDASGNSSQGSFNVTVDGASAQTANLITLVQSFNLAQGITNSLDAKLQNVLDAFNAVNAGADASTGAANLLTPNAENRADACHQLAAFVNSAAAQSGKQLTVAQANQLIAKATQIRAVLGCP